MADFNTTQVKQNTPGLTFASPKAMPAKFNTLTGTLDTTNQLVKTALAVDEKMVLDSVEKQVEEERKDYIERSLTGMTALENEKLNLQSSVQSDQFADYPEYQQEMDQLIDTQLKRQEQGLVTGAESTARINAIGERFINENPGYADKITTKIAQVLKRGSYKQILDSELAMIQAERKAKQDNFNKITKQLDDRKIRWRDKDEDEIMALYYNDKANQRDDLLIDELVKRNEMFDENKKLEFFNNIGGVGGLNGLYIESRRNFDVLFANLEFIEDTEPDIDKQNDARQQLIQAAKDKLAWTVNNLPARTEYEKARNQSFYDQQFKMIDNLDKEIQKVVPANRKQFLEEKASSLKSEQEIAAIDAGLNKYAAEIVKLKIDAYSNLVSAGQGKLLDIIFEQNPNEIKTISDALKETVLNGGKKINYESDNGQYYGEKTRGNSYGSYSSYSQLIDAEIKNKQLSTMTLGYFNNLFNVSNSLSGDNKMKELDLLIPVIATRTSDNTLATLMTQPDFSNDVLTNLEFYKEAGLSRIPDNVEVTENNGLLYAPMNPKLNNNLTSINNYILMKAKIESKKPAQIIDELLKNELSNINVKGKEPKAPVKEPTIKNKAITQEEYDKLKPNEEYTDPNGVIRIKQ